MDRHFSQNQFFILIFQSCQIVCDTEMLLEALDLSFNTELNKLKNKFQFISGMISQISSYE